MSCSMRCCTVKVWDFNCDRLCAALEIWSYWCYKCTELIFVSRFNSDNRIASEHIWTDIKGRSWSVRWYISRIGFYYLYDCIYKTVFRKYRHLKSSCGISKSLCVHIRAEYNDASVFCCVCLHTFKYWLGILQNTCTLIQYNVGIFCQASIIPLSIFVIWNISLFGRDITKSYAWPVNLFLFHCNSSIPLLLLTVTYI